MNKVKNSYEDGVCPDCQEDIPDDIVEGGECSNCGHVFYELVKTLIFTCPECGSKDLGSVERVTVIYPIKKIRIDGDLDYDTENTIEENGEVQFYGCQGCGFSLRDDNDITITDCLKVPVWVEKHCKQE